MDYLILLMAMQWFIYFLKLFFKVLVQMGIDKVDSSCKELLIQRCWLLSTAVNIHCLSSAGLASL